MKINNVAFNSNLYFQRKDNKPFFKFLKKDEFIRSVQIENTVTKNNTKTNNSFFYNTQTDEIIKNLNIEKYGTSGIPLEFSRKDYLKKVSDLLFENNNDISILKEKLNITPCFINDNEILGYNGIIDTSKLDKNDETERKIYNLTNEFLNSNKVITENKNDNKFFNDLLAEVPEFINFIGKMQHGTQQYSVDVHILKVLKEAISTPEYQNLSDEDKTILKYAIILHDIGKDEGIVDKLHPEKSYKLAMPIVEKLNLPKESKNRILNLIKHHHWLEFYNTGMCSAQDTAEKFKTGNDYEIAKIMASADLKGINEYFYFMYSDSLSQERQKPVIEALKQLKN